MIHLSDLVEHFVALCKLNKPHRNAVHVRENDDPDFIGNLLHGVVIPELKEEIHVKVGHFWHLKTFQP